jgi:hypothetical protein
MTSIQKHNTCIRITHVYDYKVLQWLVPIYELLQLHCYNPVICMLLHSRTRGYTKSQEEPCHYNIAVIPLFACFALLKRGKYYAQVQLCHYNSNLLTVQITTCRFQLQSSARSRCCQTSRKLRSLYTRGIPLLSCMLSLCFPSRGRRLPR